MLTISDFRKSEVSQLKISLSTGKSVDYLSRKINNDAIGRRKPHGNTLFSSFIVDLCGKVKLLNEEDLLDYPISVLKEAARLISELEEFLGCGYSEFNEKLKMKHFYSKVYDLFGGYNGCFWEAATKSELLSLIEEFDYWVDLINQYEILDDVKTASELCEILNKPLYKQMRQLSDLICVDDGWDQDEKIFKNIVRRICESDKDFKREWIEGISGWGAHYNVKNKREYVSLYSWFFLSLISTYRGYKCNLWGTPKQWASMGYKIKPNALPGFVFHYFKVRETLEEEFEEKNNSGFGRKVSIVFNADEVLGFEGENFAESKFKGFELIDNTLSNLGVEIVSGVNGAFYSLTYDHIQMPKVESFNSKNVDKAYYSTLLHEVTHWTGHESRCNRDLTGRFGDDKYAFEELVAEIGSNFLCNRFGFSKNATSNSISYIKSWLSFFENESFGLILEKAAMESNRAANFVFYPKDKC